MTMTLSIEIEPQDDKYCGRCKGLDSVTNYNGEFFETTPYCNYLKDKPDLEEFPGLLFGRHPDCLANAVKKEG